MPRVDGGSEALMLEGLALLQNRELGGLLDFRRSFK